MMTGDWRDREVIIAEEVFVLWPVFSSGSAGQGKAEGLFPGGLPECPEAESPAGVGGEESGIFSGAVWVCEGMAAKETVRDPGKEGRDDTRQDPPLPALPEADLADPGGEGGDDTRQDRTPKAYGEDLCSLWMRKEGDTRQNGAERRIGFRIREKPRRKKWILFCRKSAICTKSRS
jgi:hypothetical protein